jgi:hypothetical protein
VLLALAVHDGESTLFGSPETNWSSEYTMLANPLVGLAATPKSS